MGGSEERVVEGGVIRGGAGAVGGWGVCKVGAAADGTWFWGCGCGRRGLPKLDGIPILGCPKDDAPNVGNTPGFRAPKDGRPRASCAISKVLCEDVGRGAGVRDTDAGAALVACFVAGSLALPLGPGIPGLAWEDMGRGTFGWDTTGPRTALVAGSTAPPFFLAGPKCSGKPMANKSSSVSSVPGIFCCSGSFGGAGAFLGERNVDDMGVRIGRGGAVLFSNEPE